MQAELERYFDALWNVWPPRSITGDGVRRSLDILETVCGPIKRIEVPGGTKVFDWTVPPEWVVREAYIITPSGEKICDVRTSHLSLVGYSAPVNRSMSRGELDEHLHSLPSLPDAIPYVTQYYSEPRGWGFCLPHSNRVLFPEGDYHVHIDTELKQDGSLTLGEIVIPGSGDREIMLWSYVCHPNGAHHDLSANLAWAFLAKRVAAWPERRMTYRFVIGPETIGSLAYLAHAPEVPYHLRNMVVTDPNYRTLIRNLAAGFVLTCLGRGAWNYKRSRRGDTLADRAAEYVLSDPERRLVSIGGGLAARVGPFIHDYYVHEGSDELVFNRFNLPVGSLMRDRYNHFPQYHTSLDSKETISFDTIADSVDVYERVLKVIEANAVYRCAVQGVPQLGRRGIYSADDVAGMTNLYQWSDGQHDLIWIAQRSGIDIHKIAEQAKRAEAAGVLEKVT